MTIIFFDATCPLCCGFIEKIYKSDRRHQFLFAPLLGSTFAKTVKENREALLEQNTLVLAEGEKIWVRSKAVYRILWMLGGWMRLASFLCIIFPAADLIYRWIASSRSKGSCDIKLSIPKELLLP